ncbi:hypothetical protein [Agromyces larvae]|uniref:Dephospho-CoA kinase n=1 Tax=Agromyces larvae TaxID=2929802 RepID=A0ABY4C3K6_9MICO|nr:hypothetical protein [Agromyces larvae]UOE45975.1 hypothetical protein MTO99_09600 [Agromyces larvae]
MTGRLIGLGGKLRAGKDAVADHLVDAHGFVKVGMSDALHEAMLALDPIVEVADIEIRYSEAITAFGYVETKARFPEARRLLQALGTEVGRNMLGENVWVNAMERKVNAILADGKSVACTGLRFPNEIDKVNEMGGTTVWVERPGLLETSAATHASENSVGPDIFDHILVNDGTLEDLRHTVTGMLADPSTV